MPVEATLDITEGKFSLWEQKSVLTLLFPMCCFDVILTQGEKALKNDLYRSLGQKASIATFSSLFPLQVEGHASSWPNFMQIAKREICFVKLD